MMIMIKVELTEESKKQSGKVRPIDFEKDKVTITEIEESQYHYNPKEIILGLENVDRLFVTKNHFRARGHHGFAILGFKILDDNGIELQNSKQLYEITCPSTDDEYEERTLKHFDGYYFDSPLIIIEKGSVKFCNDLSSSSIGVLNPGHFYIVVRKKGDKNGLDKNYKIVVLPSSITNDDFKNMINDLIGVRQELVMLQPEERKENEGKKRQNTLFGINETYDESLLKLSSKIDILAFYLKRIDKNPKGILFTKKVVVSRNKVKKFDGAVIADYLSEKEKIHANIKTENYDIYENRLFYYAIKRLSEYFHINVFNWKIKLLYEERNALEDNISKSLEPYGELTFDEVESLVRNNICYDSQETKEKYREELFDILINNNRRATDSIINKHYKRLVIKITNEVEAKPQRKINFTICFKGKKLFVEYKEHINRMLISYGEINEKGNANLSNSFSKNKGVKLSLLGNEKQEELLNVMMGRGSATVVIDAVVMEERFESDLYIIKLNKILNIRVQNGYIQPYSMSIKQMFIQFGYLENAEVYLKEIHSYKLRKGVLNTIIGRKEELFSEIDKKLKLLLNLSLFSKVSIRKENFRMTQIIANDDNYFHAYKELLDLNEKFKFFDIKPTKDIVLKKIVDLYEYWILIMMVHILINKKWRFKNSSLSLTSIIDNYLETNQSWNLEKDFPILTFEHDINNWQGYGDKEFYKTDRKLILQIWYNHRLNYKYDMLDFRKALSQNDIKKGPHKKPDFKLDISLMEGENCLLTKHFYLDAKYRNYDDQGGRDTFVKEDIGGVAIDKYIEAFIDTDWLKADASFIVHTDKNPKYTYFGGYYDSKINGMLSQDICADINCKLKWKNEYDKESPNHQYGGFCCLPNHLNGLITFFKMILEYHFSNCDKKICKERIVELSGAKKTIVAHDNYSNDAKLYEVCWECGNSDSVYCNDDLDLIKDDNLRNNNSLVLVNVKQTANGNLKFYYKCNGCGNFWVRTICDTKEHHPLIKHTVNNYHVPEDDDIWYVKCPKCDPIIV